MAFDIPSVYEIVFKIPVSSGDHRLSDKAGDFHAIFKGFLYFQQVVGDVSSIDIIDNIFQAVIAGSVKLYLGSCNEFKRHLRV